MRGQWPLGGAFAGREGSPYAPVSTSIADPLLIPLPWGPLRAACRLVALWALWILMERQVAFNASSSAERMAPCLLGLHLKLYHRGLVP